MVWSLGIILGLGFIIGYILDKIHVPGLIGMILVGFLIGPYCLSWLSPEILNISSSLRQIALVIILTRSGLNLDLASLKKVGRSAILICFVPASFEIAGVTLGAYYLLHLSVMEGLLLGSVLAAVSPAVVSPRMIRIIEEGYGEDHAAPKLILAGSSADDIYVIVLFYAFLGLNQTNTFNAWAVASIPVSIVLGIILGICVGFALSFIFRRLKLPLALQVLCTLASSFLMIGLETLVKNYVSVSSLLGVMTMAMIILFADKEDAKKLSGAYNGLWKAFEIILFVLVGASLDFTYVTKVGGWALLVLLIGLLFRTLGVYLCLLGTKLNAKERIFAMISYLPKATVQASIGGIALASGLGCGEVVLTVAILSILVTAPIGAFGIDLSYKHLLNKINDKNNTDVEQK